MTGVPIFTARDVEHAVSPERAVEAVRNAFVAHARDEWTMPPKVYVTNYPAGDFRAMPALGAGHALLKWVTSFPGNPARGLPTVSGLVLLSDAETGELEAVLDAGAVTAIRTGAAAVLAAETLGEADADTAAVVGAGVNGRAAARTFLAQGREVAIFDLDGERARAAADELGATAAGSLADALAADLLVTVTPGHAVLLGDGSLSAGQHVSPDGRRRPRKAEITPTELARTRMFCDDWEQASPAARACARGRSGARRRKDVGRIGAVLAGSEEGRRDPAEIRDVRLGRARDQDLAIAIAAFDRRDELDLELLAV